MFATKKHIEALARGLVLSFLYFVSATTAQAEVVEWLNNGDFEDLSGDFPASWTVTSNPPGETSGFDGTSTAAVMYPDVFGGRLSQSGFKTADQWQFDLLFASGMPAASDDRTLNVILDSGGPHINLRVNGDGDIQAFQGSWQSILTDAVTFSNDGNGDGDFDDGPDLLNMHRLRIVGDYATEPAYEVMLSGANSNTYDVTSGSVSLFNGTPAAGEGIQGITLRSDASGASYVVDQASLMAETAPFVPFSGLVNGDFEDNSGDFPTDWLVVQGTPTTHAGLGGTATGAFLHGELSSGARDGARIAQEMPGLPGESWELEFLFATGDPGDSSARSLNAILTNSGNGGTLNLRVNGDGSLQAADSEASGVWVDIAGLENKVAFSVDGNGDGDFSDAGDVLNVHRFLLTADYASETPSYTVSLSEANADELTFTGESSAWFGGSPPAGTSVERLDFSAMRSTASYLVDEVEVRSLVEGGPGDFNVDGRVDGADFVAWQRALGNTLDAAALAAWQANYGAATSAAAGQQGVPEPTAAVLVLVGMLGGSVGRSRRRRRSVARTNG